MHVRLHEDHVQGLVDPPARVEDARDERALAQLRASDLWVPLAYLERCSGQRSAIGRLDASAPERQEVVPSARTRATASDNVLGPPIGLVVAELDQATALARQFHRVIRHPVTVPSVAHKTARHALDVHDLSVSMLALLRRKMMNLILHAVPGRDARQRWPGRVTEPMAEQASA